LQVLTEEISAVSEAVPGGRSVCSELGIDSEEQKAEWRKYPEKYRQYRKMVESELSGRFKFILRNSKESDEANAVSDDLRIMLFADAADLMPCSMHWMKCSPSWVTEKEALVGEKTTCYTDSIGGVTPKGFLTGDGEEVEVDVVRLLSQSLRSLNYCDVRRLEPIC
jgi:hypothetical protein